MTLPPIGFALSQILFKSHSVALRPESRWLCKMDPRFAALLLSILSLGCIPRATAESGYVITTPRRWTSNTNAQICVSLSTGTFQADDSLTANLQQAVLDNATQISESKLKFTQGGSNECASLSVPKIEDRFHGTITLRLHGVVGANNIDENVNVTVVEMDGKTFVQTDKYLYQPGQKVQFRILSVNGPLLNISTKNYEEVYIESPVGTRIFQWLNVENSKGLVHLSFDLSQEVGEGFYTVVVKIKDNQYVRQSFKVEDYVLPRYEVTIKSPKYILGSDETVTLELCARYTYGEPVKGNATLHLAAGSWQTYANLTQSKKITYGCQNFTYDTKDLLFDHNNCHIRIGELKARAVVVEDGTDVEIFGSNDAITVHRRAVQFTDETPSWVHKPFVPINIKIKAFYPDETPARNETMEVCSHYEGERTCTNFTTCPRGYLQFIMPSAEKFKDSLEITAVNYPKIERFWNDVMEKSNFYKYRYDNERYIDFSNSSLTIYEGAKLDCVTGQDINVKLPVIYYVGNNVKAADVHVQVLSRGQVQYLDKVKVDFVQTDLPFKKEEVFLDLENVPEGIVSGMFEIPMILPPTVSPSIKVLVWYTSEKGVVVADSREISITDCLPNKVDISWSAEKGEPGSETVLKLQGASNSLCSVGVVDKSVELLSSEKDPLTISEVLSAAYHAQVARWDSNQLNLEYCLRKYNNSLDKAIFAISSTPEGSESSSSVSDGSLASVALKHVIIPDFRSSDNEALHMFDDAGYYVISNLVLQKQFCDKLIIDAAKAEEYRKQQSLMPSFTVERTRPYAHKMGGVSYTTTHRGPPMAFAAPQAISADVATNVESASVGGGATETKERNYLPETWLWKLTTLSSTGESADTLVLPDTITEWVGRAVCVHPTEGVGISSSSSITTFTPFFIDLTLPATIKRGEILPLKISIFNYLDEDLPVLLTLEPSSDYEFVTEGNSVETGLREMCITAKDKSVQVIKMKFKNLGDINITVEAATNPKAPTCGSGSPPKKSDRLKRALPVEAEGFLKEKTWTQYVCSHDIADPSASDAWNIEAPANIVEGSDRAWLTAIGDLMGPTLENIGNLIRLPSGCGEQNMINFAPNVYVRQYLDASNQTTDEIKKKIGNYLMEGYQRQLTYRHTSDGSYSVFGEKDANGSTWLTAFVVKSFAQAKPYVFIDEGMFNQSIDLLKELQSKSTGCFESRGRVINKMLQGGISSSGNPEVLLSAYVLAAILEANSSPNSMESAIKCVENDTSTHPYSLALRAYSLSLAKAPSTKVLIDQLLGAAVSNSSFMRWTFDSQDKNEALEVETAAYALLALLKYNPDEHSAAARKIVRWLSGQRNGQGGFISTQDTVIGLQSLAAFEKVQPQGALNAKVHVKTKETDFQILVTEDTKFLQQRHDLVDVPASVGITVSGTGCALIQGVLRYNVLVESPNNAFTLKINATAKSATKCKSRHLSACTSYTLPDGASGMAILEFKLVSGYIPVKDDLKRIVGDGRGVFKRYEVDGSKVFFYLEEVTKDEVCAEFEVEQIVEIEAAKPGTVTVYDYYQPEYKSSGNYTFPASC